MIRVAFNPIYIIYHNVWRGIKYFAKFYYIMNKRAGDSCNLL